MTNQLKLPSYADAFRKKVQDVMKELGVPALFYAAIGRSAFRKPSTAIFSDHLLPLLKKNNVETINSILYIGDAAGRSDDFNDSDRKFLYNTNLFLNSKLNPLNYGKKALFKTPEEYFQGKKPEPFECQGINPKKIMDAVLDGKNPREMDTSLDDYFEDSDTQEVILMIGPPACGKSTIAKRICRDYGYKKVSRDILKTKVKEHKTLREYLRQGKSVVIDNTNLKPVNRKELIKIAQDHFANKNLPVKIRAFHINGDWSRAKQVEFAKHLNIVRLRIKNIYISDVAYRTLLKKFESPDESEGFTEVINIPFIPRFKNAEHVLSFLQKS